MENSHSTSYKKDLDKSELCAQIRASSLADGMPVWQGLTNRQ